MIKNYFTIAWRNLVHNKLHTIINVIGLTVGISACLTIFLLVHYEFGYNQVSDADRIFRIYSNFSGAFDGTNRGVTTGVQAMVKDQFTGTDVVAPLHTYSAKVKLADRNKELGNQETIAIVDETYFALLKDYTWVEGSPATSLSKPFQVVLTSSKAKKYFETTEPSKIIGQTIHYNDSLVLTVSGIVNDLSIKSDFDFTDFISISTIDQSFLKDNIEPNNWGNTNSSAQLFIKIKDLASLGAIEQQLKKLDETYVANNKDAGWFLTYKLQPLDDLHFNGTLGIFDRSRIPASKSTLTTLIVVALLLLLIASINFINLETAQAVKRAKEVGVRKVLGGSRSQLVGQFLGQSILLTIFAVLLSLPLCEFSLIFFHKFIPAGVALDLAQWQILLFLGLVILVVGILSGLYPAFYLSSFLPALALKNQAYVNSANSRTAYLRKTLIIFQFGFAQVLIIGTFVVLSQINFMLTKDLGFTRDAIVNIGTPWRESASKRSVFRNELAKIKEVEAISFCSGAPAQNGFSSSELTYKGSGEEIKTMAFRKFGDENYLSLYGIQLVAGRNLVLSDSMREVLINETYAKELGLTPEESIGKELIQNNNAYPIVGVVKDFHIMSLVAEYKPVYMACETDHFYSFSMKLQKTDGTYQAGISQLEQAWKNVYPDEPFNYTFVDETIKKFYSNEQNMSQLISTAMGIAIIICCLGLFGLASFTSIQRTKEIGIRKVMGATVNNIVLLLSTDFLKLVLISFAIAAPVAYYFSQNFLDKYAFHIEMSWWLFAAAGFSSVLIAVFTVGYQAIKAAIAKPVDSLKNE
ncbi:MAG: ABC transporter permease [Cyclobacteriaceae bacterium]|jgi:putative ABC transport system permease protein|nr:ABC transporter permease [Flammeovirgaceae bacterium]